MVCYPGRGDVTDWVAIGSIDEVDGPTVALFDEVAAFTQAQRVSKTGRATTGMAHRVAMMANRRIAIWGSAGLIS